MKTDWLIVGAGLTGVTLAERIASQRAESVLIVDQRDHVGGNAYDEYNEAGILSHIYGPHIFHTNSCEVFDYLSKFTSWRPYQHKVLGWVDGRLVPLPFNLNSMSMLFPPTLGERLADKLVAAYGFGARVPILKMRQTDDGDVKFLADYVYRKVFENYTKKQWGMAPEDLAPSVTARVPILVSRDDRYFQDEFQAMPSNGYTVMVRRMLAHSNIHVLLNTPWSEIADEVRYERLIFTGPIDEFFEFRYGALPYRSLRFEIETYSRPRYQEAAVINYPNDYAFTRVTEQKWLTGQEHAATTVLKEKPYPVSSGAINIL